MVLPSEVDWWCKTQIETYKSRIRGLRTLHNSAAPINVLPPELLAEIFINVTHSSRWYPLPVTRVCSGWRILINHTPQFWTNFLAVGPRYLQPAAPLFRAFAVLRGALARSGALPISLSIYPFPEPGRGIIFPHRHRIVSLTVVVDSSQAEALRTMFEGEGMPQLRELDIQHYQRLPRSNPNLLDGTGYSFFSPTTYLPRLTSLGIGSSHFFAHRGTPSFKKLTFNQWCSCDGAHTIDTLVYELQQRPQLESLYITYRGSFGLPSVRSEITIPIAPLLALRTLHVIGIPSNVCPFLADFAVPPQCNTTVLLRQDSGLIPELAPLQALLVGATCARVRIGVHTLELHTTTSNGRPIAASVPRLWGFNPPEITLIAAEALAELLVPIESIATLFVNALALAPPRNCPCHRCRDGHWRASVQEERVKVWATLLAGFPGIVRLEAPEEEGEGDGIDALRALAGYVDDTARDASDVVAPPLCPGLECVSIAWRPYGVHGEGGSYSAHSLKGTHILYHKLLPHLAARAALVGAPLKELVIRIPEQILDSEQAGEQYVSLTALRDMTSYLSELVENVVVEEVAQNQVM